MVKLALFLHVPSAEVPAQAENAATDIPADPCEPLVSLSLKWLSLRTLFLLALTFAKRVEEIDALPVHEGFLEL